MALLFRQFLGLPREGGAFGFRCLLTFRQRASSLGEVPLCLRHGGLAGLEEAVVPLRGLRLRCNLSSSRLEFSCALRNLGLSLRQGGFARVQLFRRELDSLLDPFEFRAAVREFLPSLRELASVSLQRRTLCDQGLLPIRESGAAFLEFLLGRREGCLASFERPFCLACALELKGHLRDRSLVRLRLPREFRLTLLQVRCVLGRLRRGTLELLLGPIQFDAAPPNLIAQLAEVRPFIEDLRGELLEVPLARLEIRLVRLGDRLPLDERLFARLQI